MYPGLTGAPENHKQGYCLDGVKSKPPENRSSDCLPEWPQPNGIYSARASFNLVVFLSAICDVYQKVLVDGCCRNKMMEYEVFVEMLVKCTSARPDGAIVFKLYPEFVTESCPDKWIVKEASGEEVTYLWMDCLQDS